MRVVGSVALAVGILLLMAAPYLGSPWIPVVPGKDVRALFSEGRPVTVVTRILPSNPVIRDEYVAYALFDWLGEERWREVEVKTPSLELDGGLHGPIVLEAGYSLELPGQPPLHRPVSARGLARDEKVRVHGVLGGTLGRPTLREAVLTTDFLAAPDPRLDSRRRLTGQCGYILLTVGAVVFLASLLLDRPRAGAESRDSRGPSARGRGGSDRSESGFGETRAPEGAWPGAPPRKPRVRWHRSSRIGR